MTTTTATDSAATADNNHDSHNDASLQTPAPSARPEGNGGRLFSPRSTAALALSSIITQREEGTENDHPNQNNNNEEDEDSGNESPNDRVSKTSTDNHHHHHHDKDDEAKLLKAPVQNTPPDHPYSHPSAVPYYNNGDNNNHHGYHPNLPPQSYHPSHMAPHMAPHMPPSYRQPLQVKSSSSSTTSSSGANMMDNTPSNNNRWWMPPPPPPPPGYYNMGRHPSYPPPPQYAPNPYGHMPMDPRMPPYGHPHAHPPPPPHMMAHNKHTHGRNWASPTPDGKRLKPSNEEGASYNRKLKSLGILAETFVDKHKELPNSTSVVVDDMARMLGVERRRIYDVVNILESVTVVVKKSKNTYIWMGLQVMPHALGSLQEEAIARYPQDALENGLISPEECAKYEASPPPPESIHHKTLNRLTQQFLHVFLVGHKTMSLPEASDKIHGSSSTMLELAKLGGWDMNQEDDETGMAMHKAASKGLKTKIRRLYDVSNVLSHLNWVSKMAPSTHQPKLQNDIAPLLLERRPQYKWQYYMSPHEIRAAYMQHQHASTGEYGAPTNRATAPYEMVRRVTMEDDVPSSTPSSMMEPHAPSAQQQMGV